MKPSSPPNAGPRTLKGIAVRDAETGPGTKVSRVTWSVGLSGGAEDLGTIGVEFDVSRTTGGTFVVTELDGFARGLSPHLAVDMEPEPVWMRLWSDDGRRSTGILEVALKVSGPAYLGDQPTGAKHVFPYDRVTVKFVVDETASVVEVSPLEDFGISPSDGTWIPVRCRKPSFGITPL